MSYMEVFQAIEEGDVVTFNDSGGANAQATPELRVLEHTNRAIQRFENLTNGNWWQLVKRDGEFVLQFEEGPRFDGQQDEWKDYDTVETFELIAEPGEVSADV